MGGKFSKGSQNHNRGNSFNFRGEEQNVYYKKGGKMLKKEKMLGKFGGTAQKSNAQSN